MNFIMDESLGFVINRTAVAIKIVARTGIPGFTVGNTAEMILSQIDCSVLAIKPTGFVTPVTMEV